jgi:DNA-binding CsgD family transcriptional regulator
MSFLGLHLFLLVLISLYVIGRGFTCYEASIVQKSGLAWSSVINRFVLLVMLGAVGLFLFHIVRDRFRICLSKVKRFAVSLLALLTPQLVFSASLVRNGRISYNIFSPFPDTNLLLLVAVLLFSTVSVVHRISSKDSNELIRLMKVALCGSVVLMLSGISELFLAFARFDSAGHGLQGFFSLPACLIFGILSIVSVMRYSHAPYGGRNGVMDGLGISPRESEIVHLVITGYSNRQIGDRLYISLSTVKSHLYSIYRKLGVGSRMELLNRVKGEFGYRRCRECRFE